MSAMRRGDFASAWAISDAVLATRDPATRDDPTLPYHCRWVWDGGPFAGKRALVRCYHGLGDTIQFVRFLPLLRRLVRLLWLEVQPELVPLLADLPGPDRLIPFLPDAPHPPAECDFELMELPHALRIRPECATRDVPYLAAPARSVSAERARIGADRTIPPSSPAYLLSSPPRLLLSPPRKRGSIGGAEPPGAMDSHPRVVARGRFGGNDEKRSNLAHTAITVGLCWRAGDWDERRSLPLRLLTEAVSQPGVRLVSLQQVAAREEAAAPGAPPFLNPRDRSRDVMDTAALIAAVDLVVTVDTMVAHLAGALGRPTWLLLKADADWRWMEARDDSPWYPSFRLYRQKAPGDWRDPLARIAADLSRAVSERGRY